MSENNDPKLYGKFRIVRGKPLGIAVHTNNLHRNKFKLVAHDNNLDEGDGNKRKRVQDQFQPYGRPRKLRKLDAPPPIPLPPPALPPVPPPPIIKSIGVMDIGQGSCNLLINQNNNPQTYFDVGLPLWFFNNSRPLNMRVNTIPYQGPIIPTPANNVEIVLSHWDWDHWRLGLVGNMNNCNWTVPNQLLGPSALAFWNTVPIANSFYYPAGAPFMAGNGYVIYECAPAAGMNPAAAYNNSGLAMQVYLNLPSANPVWATALLIADANFDSAPNYPAFGALTAITASHHGSNANGAAANIPPQTPAYVGQGRIAYSYGVSDVTGAHAYGFPVAAAVNNYRAAFWGIAGAPNNINECGTAEGFQINSMPPALAQRGNIRLGNNAPLNAAYALTAFFNIAHQLD